MHSLYFSKYLRYIDMYLSFDSVNYYSLCILNIFSYLSFYPFSHSQSEHISCRLLLSPCISRSLSKHSIGFDMQGLYSLFCVSTLIRLMTDFLSFLFYDLNDRVQ